MGIMGGIGAASSQGVQQGVMGSMSALQNEATLFGARQFAQELKAQENLTEISNAQNEATNFLQTMASNAKSAVAKD